MARNTTSSLSATVIVTLACVAAVATQAQTVALFAARGPSFQSGNDGPTDTSSQADVRSGLCLYLSPADTVGTTDTTSNRTTYTCPMSASVRINSTVQYCQDAGRACDYTVVWGYTGVNGTALVAATVNGITKDKANMLSAFKGKMIDLAVGTTIDRPPEDLQVITGFIVTLTLGYLAFSVLLFISFCLVQHFYVNRD